ALRAVIEHGWTSRQLDFENGVVTAGGADERDHVIGNDHVARGWFVVAMWTVNLATHAHEPIRVWHCHPDTRCRGFSCGREIAGMLNEQLLHATLPSLMSFVAAWSAGDTRFSTFR